MPSQYQTIGGVKYERDLITLAKQLSERRGTLNKEDVTTIWDKALDGNRVTETERRTIDYILNHFKLQASAKNFLEGKLRAHAARSGDCTSTSGRRQAEAGSPGAVGSLKRKSTSYYKFINGSSHDRQLLEQAEEMATTRNGELHSVDVLKLWANAHDGKGVTDIEKRTLAYIRDEYKLASDAKEVLNTALASLTNDGAKLSQAKALTRESASELSIERAPDEEGRPGIWRKLVNFLFGSSVAKPMMQEMPAGKKRRLQDSPGGSPGVSGLAEGSDNVEELRHTLEPDLQELLAQDVGETASSGPLALECQYAGGAAAEADAATAMARSREKAEQEIDRILTLRKVSDILGQGSREDQQREFKRIALLLHPDKGVVESSNQRAALAMQLAMAAVKRARRAKGKGASNVAGGGKTGSVAGRSQERPVQGNAEEPCETSNKRKLSLGLNIDGKPPKTALNTFLQRYCKKPIRRTDVVYQVTKYSTGFQCELTLHCLDGIEFAGEVAENEWEAQNSVATIALEHYMDEVKSLPPSITKLKKKCRPHDRSGVDSAQIAAAAREVQLEWEEMAAQQRDAGAAYVAVGYGPQKRGLS